MESFDFDIDIATYRQLQKKCKELNLKPCTGSTDVLRDRVRKHFQASATKSSSLIVSRL